MIDAVNLVSWEAELLYSLELIIVLVETGRSSLLALPRPLGPPNSRRPPQTH